MRWKVSSPTLATISAGFLGKTMGQLALYGYRLAKL
jgi:hypothetical protein